MWWGRCGLLAALLASTACPVGQQSESVKVLIVQSCPTLCDPMDCSLPSSSVHGILQARIWEWAAMPSSRDLPDPGIEPMSLAALALADGFFTSSATW